MGLDEELSSSEKDDSSNKPPIEKVVYDATIENGSEEEDSGSASMEIHERRTNGNTVHMGPEGPSNFTKNSKVPF